MAEDVAMFGRRDLASIQVQVRSTDCGSGHSKDDVVRLLERGVGNGIHPDIVCTVVGQCSHGLYSSKWIFGHL
ncbi:hypothetical protein D3C77_748600 [compost metagenome]